MVDTHLNSIPGKVFSFIHFVMDPVDRERKSETEGKRKVEIEMKGGGGSEEDRREIETDKMEKVETDKEKSD